MRCALPLPARAAETYTPHRRRHPGGQFNKAYLTPASAVPSLSVGSASDKRCSFRLHKMKSSSIVTAFVLTAAILAGTLAYRYYSPSPCRSG